MPTTATVATAQVSAHIVDSSLQSLQGDDDTRASTAPAVAAGSPAASASTGTAPNTGQQSIESFLRRRLPAEGLYAIARFVRKSCLHQICDSIEEAAAYVAKFDAQGLPTYYAMAAFKEHEVDGVKNGKPIKQFRVRKNVRAIKTYWADLDVESGNEKKYESQEAALDGVIAFHRETGLPMPTIGSSGGGLHCYWDLVAEVDRDTWEPVAETLKTLAAKLKFKADPACTSDPVRILRPVGTWNRKDPNNPRPVEIIAESDPIAFEDFREKVERAARAAGCKISEPRPQGGRTSAGINQDFAVARDFPPFSAHKVADHCKQIAMMRDTKGRIAEPHWFTCIQTLRHSVEGAPLIHEWSNGHDEYSVEDTNEKIAKACATDYGPAFCDTFEKRNPGGCDGCASKGKGLTPAHLGTWPLEIPVIQNVPTLPHRTETPMRDAGAKAHESQGGCGAPAPAAPPDVVLTPVLQALDGLNRDYAWVEKQMQIFRFQYGDFIKPDTFKTALANRPPVQIAVGNKDPKSVPIADAWLRWHARREHRDIVYEPGRDLIHNDQINLWPGWGCEPAKGEISQWQYLLDIAFGRDTFERTWFEQWAAYPLQYPGTKLFTAVMLWGAEEGLGKSLIGYTLGRIYGDNFREIDNDALDKPFNTWVKGKQFILGEEITSGDRRATMNRLKHLITGETIGLEEKYQPEIVLRNTINFMFTSNSPDALHIGMNDRRMCVVEFAGSKQPKEFFDEFLTWRDTGGGLSAIMHHLLRLSLRGFSPTAEAPKTRAKEEMMDATFSDIERWIYERYLDPMVTPPSELVYTGDLAAEYLGQKGQHVSETAIGRALTKLGSRVKRRIIFPEARKQLHAIRRYRHWDAAAEKIWADEYRKGRAIQMQITTAVRGAPTTV